MSFWAIAVMRFLSRSMIVCPLPAIRFSSSLMDFEHQLALQMTALADPVGLGGVSELEAGNCRWRHCSGRQQLQHPLQMRTVASDARAQHLDILAHRLETRRSRRNPDQ